MRELALFFEIIKDDHRIGPVHVSMYAALLSMRNETAHISFFPVSRKVLMSRSKILGKTTYYKCLNDLAECGYIEYKPEHRLGKTMVCCLPFG
jgi:hypothetical protein